MSLNGLGIWYCENMFLFLCSIIPTNRNESTKSYHLNLGNRSVSVDLTMKKTLKNIWNLYYDGFKNMTWGRPLWLLIFLKVIILFLVLRSRIYQLRSILYQLIFVIILILKLIDELFCSF